MASAYIASPFGFSAATEGYYRDVLLAAVQGAGITVLDPWGDPAAAVELRRALALDPGEARVAALKLINARIGAANAAMIDRADGMLAILDGADVDSGTAAEIGYAAARGKPIIGLRLDTRRAGDNEGATVNLQIEHFIRGAGGCIVRTLDEALTRLVTALGL